MAAQRSSAVQVMIGEQAQKETIAMKAIGVITMTFLPATFISVSLGLENFKKIVRYLN